jgi:hypothetical protein
MKKTFIISTCSLLLLGISCKKNTEGNKSVLKQENGYSADLPKDSINVVKQTTNTDTPEYTERYVGTDGSSALVTFKNSDKEKAISIFSNNKTINAPQKEETEKVRTYGNFDFTIVAKNDSITITQGDNVILLKKARGQ